MIDSESPTETTDLLGVPPGHLALRLHGGGRDGQMVTIDAKKCWVGSGPSCTLRVEADGVSPVHCLILHGARRTVVRRLAPDTRLNGRSFIDSQLGVSDRLAIGPVEFEVLQATAVDAPPHDDTPPGSPQIPEVTEGDSTAFRAAGGPQMEPGVVAATETDRDRLAAAAGINRRRARTLLRRAQELRNRLALEAADRGRALEEAAQLRRAAAEAASSSDRLRSLERELEARRREFEQQKAELARSGAEPKTGPHAERDALESERQAFTDERKQWDDQRSNQLIELDERDRQLRFARAQCESERATLERQRETLELECEQTQRRMHGQIEQLQRLEQQIHEFRSSLDHERQQWESGCRQRESVVDERLKQLETTCVTLAPQGETQPRESEPASQKMQEQMAQLQRLDQQMHEFRSSLENERQQWESGSQQQESVFGQRLGQIEATCSALQQQRERSDDALQQERLRLEATVQQLDDGLEDLKRFRSQLREDHLAATSESEALGAAVAAATSPTVDRPIESEEVADKGPSEEPPVTANEILERLGTTAPADDEEEEQPAAADTEEEQPVTAELTSDRRAESTTQGAGLPADAATEDTSAGESSRAIESQGIRAEDDDSIQDYMSRLIARTRGGASTASMSVPPAVASSPSAQASSPPAGEEGSAAGTNVAASLPSEGPESEQQIRRRKRRARAPRMTSDLPAMRELAKLTAQHALDQHARVELRQVFYTKMAMVLIALAAGIFLLIRSESHGFNFYAGLISLGVAAVWTLQFAAATARRHVARARATAPSDGHISRPDQNPPDADAPSQTDEPDEALQNQPTVERSQTAPDATEVPSNEREENAPMRQPGAEKSEPIDRCDS